MSIDLNRTISWTEAVKAAKPGDAADLAMLVDLQGNILKGHGRKRTANIFFRVADAASAKKFLKAIGAEMTSALDQLLKTQVFKAAGVDGGIFLAAFLSAEGYGALGLLEKLPKDPAFALGMGKRRGELLDPAKEAWDDGLNVAVHGMLLVGADDPKDPAIANGAARDAALAAMLARIAEPGSGLSVARVEKGDALFNKEDGNGIEQFGYVDGRSQPLMLEEDLAQEPASHWNPRINLAQVLVKDPGGQLDVSCGSYFVFRKLEQRVKAFKTAEAAMADKLGMKDPDDERAGASVVGRFENGTPVTTFHASVAMGSDKTVVNDFNYEADAAGLKCPFAAHIRKTNPRRPETQRHLMARRGIPFGIRADDPNDGEFDNKPEGGVGLLFMSYQSNLIDQFEFTQRRWANDPSFDFNGPQPVGIDPVIGQGADKDSFQRYPVKWQIGPLSEPQKFAGFVEMRGGEYFFAPSLSFFKLLAP
jgi:Dyp-type peroxidase family